MQGNVDEAEVRIGWKGRCTCSSHVPIRKPAVEPMSQVATANPSFDDVRTSAGYLFCAPAFGPDKLSNKVRHVSAAERKAWGEVYVEEQLRQVRRMGTRVLTKSGRWRFDGCEMRMFPSCLRNLEEAWIR